MPSNHLILCYPLLLLLSIFPSIKVFSNKSLFTSVGQGIGTSTLKSVLPMSIQGWFPLRLTGLISLLSNGLLSLLQLHSLKALVLQCSAFFMVQLSHLYMTTGKTIALIIRTFVIKVVSLLFNTLSRFVIAFLLRSNCLLISWLQSPSTMILGPKRKKTWFCLSPFYIPYLLLLVLPCAKMQRGICSRPIREGGVTGLMQNRAFYIFI